jgi:RimJ/RimL family protein N-acetyltransferase
MKIMAHVDAAETTIRRWREDDAADLAVQANDRRVWANLRDGFPHPYGLKDAKRFIMMARQMEPQTYFAIEASGRLAGGIGYHQRADVERIGAEIGYWLGREFWGRGIGTAALRAATDHAFRNHAELRRLYAVPYSGNVVSARMLEKVGYRCEGTLRQSAIKDGRVLDQLMYAILREEWEASS